MMDLNTLQTFVEVVRAGGFSAAARRLDAPRSTVSARIQALESALGVRLFKRSTRAIALTGEGLALFEGSSAALDVLRRAASSVNVVKGEFKGAIRLTAPADFPTDILADALGEFHATHPKVTFEVMLTNDVLDLVAENIDIGLRMGDSNPQTTVRRRVARFAYGLFASPSHLAERSRIRSLDDIDVFLSPPRPVRDYLTKHVFKARPFPKPQIEVNNYLLIRDLAIAGRGVALLPEAVCLQQIASGALRRVLAAQFVGTVTMTLSFPNRADMNERVRAFADHLTHHLSVHRS